MSELPINEIFESIQCEGTLTGTPALFIRFQGCKIKCPWCDTKNCWEVDIDDEVKHHSLIINKHESNSKYFIFDEEKLVDLITKHYPAPLRPHIVITGGEPYQYSITDLINQLDRCGYSIQIETSGVCEIISPDYIWLTMSPKAATAKENLKHASEIKYIVSGLKDIEYIKTKIQPYLKNNCPIHLQPMSCGKEETRICVAAALTYNWMVSFQVHKYAGIK